MWVFCTLGMEMEVPSGVGREGLEREFPLQMRPDTGK